MKLLENPDVRDPVVDYAKGLGWEVLILDYSGWPDRLFISPSGVHVYMEFKRPKGGKVRPLQDHRHAALLRRGCNVYVINDVDKGKSTIDHHSD